MQNIADSESGVTVSEEPYIEDDKEASKAIPLFTLFVSHMDILFVLPKLRLIIAPLPSLNTQLYPPPILPCILGHPALTLQNYIV